MKSTMLRRALDLLDPATRNDKNVFFNWDKWFLSYGYNILAILNALSEVFLNRYS